MKKIYTVLFMVPFLALAQPKLNVEYDKYDSVLKISTERMVIKSKMLRPDYAGFKVFRVIHKSKKAFLSNGFTNVLFIVKADRTMSVDNKTIIKIEFDDGSIKEYNHEGGYKISLASDIVIISFDVSEDDYLYTHKIKSFKIDGISKAYEIEGKNATIMYENLLAVKNYKE